MKELLSWLSDKKTIWVICQIGAGIFIATKIGLVWAIVSEIAFTMFMCGAYVVWEPELPSRYISIDDYAKEFGRMIRSKRYTKAQLNKRAYDILDRYTDMQFNDDPRGYMEH